MAGVRAHTAAQRGSAAAQGQQPVSEPRPLDSRACLLGHHTPKPPSAGDTRRSPLSSVGSAAVPESSTGLPSSCHARETPQHSESMSKGNILLSGKAGPSQPALKAGVLDPEIPATPTGNQLCRRPSGFSIDIQMELECAIPCSQPPPPAPGLRPGYCLPHSPG